MRPSTTTLLAVCIAVIFMSASFAEAGVVYVTGTPSLHTVGLTCVDPTCTPTNPCYVSALTILTLSDSCQLIWVSGTTIPGFSLAYLGILQTLTLTMSSTGPVTWSNAVSLNMGTAATLQFVNFTATITATTTLRAANLRFQNSTFTHTAQWAVSNTNAITITSSSFTGSTPLLGVTAGTLGTPVTMTGVTSTGNGVVSVTSTAGSEPPFTATNCVFTNGLSYPTSRFGTITWNNVTAQMTAAGKAFGISPKAFDCTTCTLSSPASSSLADTATVVGTSISIKSSTWTNIGASIGRVATALFQNFAVTMIDQTAAALDLSAGVSSGITFNTASFTATTPTGTVPLIRLKAFNANITVTNTGWTMTQAAGATTVGLGLGTGGYVLSNAQALPNTQLSAGNTFWFAPALTWNGNILNDGSGASTWYIRSGTATVPTNTIALTAATSMTIGNVIVDVGGAASMSYTVTSPNQGIRCLSATNCFRLATSVIPAITWNEGTLGLPTIGTPYTFIQGTPNTYGFSAASTYSVSGGYTAGTSVAFFEFNAVTCNSNCVAANSGICVSTAVCTCLYGYAPPFCACPTTGCVPTAPVSPPVNPPTNPPTNPPVNPPVAEPVNAPTNPPVNPPVAAPVNPPIAEPINIPPVEVPVNPPTNPPTAEPVLAPVLEPTNAPVNAPIEAPITTTPEFAPSDIAPEVVIPSIEPTAAPSGGAPSTGSPVLPPDFEPAIATPVIEIPVGIPIGVPIGIPAPISAPVVLPPTSVPSVLPPSLAPVLPPTSVPSVLPPSLAPVLPPSGVPPSLVPVLPPALTPALVPSDVPSTTQPSSPSNPAAPRPASTPTDSIGTPSSASAATFSPFVLLTLLALYFL